ncbi:hypothetical protein FJZ31_15590 [Candidatus Poribacteria bacterium]|nr:hypothetical protein [Candidatus Poribacteria bacterium]
MSDKTFADLTKEEFEGLLKNMMKEHFHDLSPSEFFTALDAISEEQPQEIIELTVFLKNGELIFKEPAPLFVKGNEIHLGDKRLVINLAP